MAHTKPVRFDLDAMRVLTEWKYQFDELVCDHATQLAAASGSPERVTLLHFRQAAKSALQSLAATIECEGNTDGKERAA